MTAAGCNRPRAAPNASSIRTKSTACSASASAEGGADDKSGIRAIINSALVSYERLPMLEIVFDRLVRMMTTSLRNFTSDNVEVSLDSITVDPLRRLSQFDSAAGDARRVQGRGVGQFRPRHRRHSSLIYSIVDVLLGGRRGTAAMRVEGRPYTTIERTLVKRMIEVVLNDADRPSSRCRRSTSASTAWRPTRASPPSRARPTPPSW